MKIEKVTKNTVVRQVMEQIKTLIATGELKPGDKIPTENMLAEQFGTGRSTIREAIKIFEYLGVIESNTRTGTYVCDYSNISTEALTWSILLGKNELFELVDLRRIIEQRALSLLIQKAEDDKKFLDGLLFELESVVGEMEKAVNSSAMADLIATDYNFHASIINASGNNVYINIYQTLKSFMHEEIEKTNKEDTVVSTVVDEHRAIVEAVRKKDLTAALNALDTHINNTIQQLS